MLVYQRVLGEFGFMVLLRLIAGLMVDIVLGFVHPKYIYLVIIGDLMGFNGYLMGFNGDLM